jgi:sentrin-specific protease 1
MNTFFMEKLLTSDHGGVRRWTHLFDIFSFDVLAVPVHIDKIHWCLSIINMRDKAINYYDSMGNANYKV